MTKDNLLAAEYALGLLDEPERRVAKMRAAAELTFAEEVEWWREQLGTFDAAPVAPPTHLWRAIETRLGANDNAAGARGWKWATAATSALAAVLLGVIVLRPAAVPLETRVATGPGLKTTPLVASLTGKRGDIVSITYNPDVRTAIVSPLVSKLGARDVELWIIPLGSAVPQSLGVIDARIPQLRDIASARSELIQVGATFAISLEPRGGSKTGAPTGPVIATGKIVSV